MEFNYVNFICASFLPSFILYQWFLDRIEIHHYKQQNNFGMAEHFKAKQYEIHHLELQLPEQQSNSLQVNRSPLTCFTFPQVLKYRGSMTVR